MRAKLEAFWHNAAGGGAVRGISGKCGLEVREGEMVYCNGNKLKYNHWLIHRCA